MQLGLCENYNNIGRQLFFEGDKRSSKGLLYKEEIANWRKS